MSNPRTEKSIKKVMEHIKLGIGTGVLHHFNIKTGNATFQFYNLEGDGDLVASFSLSQLIAKRGPRRKAKKGGK